MPIYNWELEVFIIMLQNGIAKLLLSLFWQKIRVTSTYNLTKIGIKNDLML